MEDMVTDYWAHYYDKNGIKDEVEDTEFDLDAELKRIAQEAGDDDWEEVLQ